MPSQHEAAFRQELLLVAVLTPIAAFFPFSSVERNSDADFRGVAAPAAGLVIVELASLSRPMETACRSNLASRSSRIRYSRTAPGPSVSGCRHG
ncbi:MAG: hypothetical protein IPM01_29090 [Burkholderiaceae bacterium]|nr:hypothetical protein [Burkholderiaceae bacterium]